MQFSRAQRVIERYEAILRPRKAGATLQQPAGPRKTAAVFVLFRERQDNADVLLMRRPRERGRHRGEWAFPGGVIEEDDASPLEAAFREVEEELGITSDSIDHWGELDPVSTVGTQFSVWPFTGRVKADVELKPSPAEVEELQWFPLETFTSLAMRRSIHLRRNGTVRDLHAYAHNGMVIWGATARILSQVFDTPEDDGGMPAGEYSEVIGQ